MNLVAKSVAVVLRGIGKMTGGGFLEQIAEFVTDLNDLFGGFKERARKVSSAFRSPDFCYVLVTSPEPVAVREAMFFAERLKELGMPRDAVVINRVHRAPDAEPTKAEVTAALAASEVSLSDGAEERLLSALTDERRWAERDAAHLSNLDSRLFSSADGGPVRIEIPALPSDVHDLATLGGIASILCPPS